MILPREKQTLPELLDQIRMYYRSIRFDCDIAGQDHHNWYFEDKTRLQVQDIIEATMKKIRDIQHLISIGYYKEFDNYGSL